MGILIEVERMNITKKSQKYVTYLVLTVMSAIMLFPFVWMVSSSLKPAGSIIAYPPTLFPREPTLEHYGEALRRLDIMTLYKNSGIIAVTKTALTVFICSILGYIFAKFSFWGKEALFLLVLSIMIVPDQVYVIPLYLLMHRLGWINTYKAVVIPFSFSAYGVFMFRQFAQSLPDDILDAARVDGCGEWTIFRQIVVPLTKPALSALTIFYFLWSWNDFLWPLVIITGSDNYTLPIGLANFIGEFFSEYGVSLAGATFAIIPMLLVFILFQRDIIAGIALTGIKG